MQRHYFYWQRSSIVKAMVFPVFMYECESWTIKKAGHWRIDAFKWQCWIRLLRVPWTARRSNQSILKEINSEYSLEGLMLKLQYFGHLCEKPAHWKRPWCWERLRAGGEKGNRECDDGQHHQLNGHEFEQTLGDSERQGSLIWAVQGNSKSWAQLSFQTVRNKSHLTVTDIRQNRH